jgi:hypothetical protein
MGPKIIPIILLILILLIGGIAFSFYNAKEQIKAEKEEVEKERDSLAGENDSLRSKNSRLERDKTELEQRLNAVNAELSRLEQERDTWRTKWEEVSRERDALVEQIKQPTQRAEVGVTPMSQPVQVTMPTTGVSEEHWADFVKKKATLEAQTDVLNQNLLEAKSKISQLDKDNKELSIKIDQLAKERERLGEEIRFKERTLRVMSMDLVSEREERGAAVKELRKLRSENVSLKQELVLANKEKMRLQDTLKETTERKQMLEDRIAEAENVLKEKSLAFSELQDQLQRAIAGGKRVMATESASVELPPIVVKPDAPGLRGLRGEIIAVNREEKFVVVDIGESSGLRPGALLKVMRGDREIATIEVIETRKEIAAADVKEVIGGLSLQEGDVVISR